MVDGIITISMLWNRIGIQKEQLRCLSRVDMLGNGKTLGN